MQMSDEEIRRNYGSAKHKNRQIGILADLNACSVEEIKRILGIDKEIEKTLETELQEPTKSELLALLFSKLDEIDAQIKLLEKEYRDVITAIEVVSALKT